MRAILDFVNYKLWNTNGSITVPPKHTGSLCRVVPSLAPGSCSRESRKCQQEKQRLCFALLAELLEMPARHFSPSWKLAFQTTEGEWYLPNHCSHYTGRKRPLLYFDKKDPLLTSAEPESPESPGWVWAVWGYCVTCLADAGPLEQC